MSRCILHIGLEKTGSTSIQSTLAKNRALLRQHGVLYPRSLGERSHVKAYAFASEDGLNEIKFQCGLRDLRAIEDFRRGIHISLEREIRDARPELTLISNEHCSSRLCEISEIERLNSLLRQFFSSVSVVVYLRAQGDSLRSAYSTLVKTGENGPFEFPNARTIDEKYDYDNILQKWEFVFGFENIDVRLFDSYRIIDRDIVRDFISKVDIEIPASSFTLDLGNNVSLSQFSIDFLKSMNDHIPYKVDDQMNPLRGNLHDLVEQFNEGAPFAGDTTIMSALDQAMSAGNERVRQRYFPHMAEPLFRPAQYPMGANDSIEPIPEAAIRLMARLWEAKQQQVLQLRQRLERMQAGDGQGPARQRRRRGADRGAT